VDSGQSEGGVPDFPLSTPFEGVVNKEYKRRVDVAKARIVETKGLLEFTGTSVDLFHRSAYDFLQESPQIREVSEKYRGLRPAAVMVKTHLAHLWICSLGKISAERLAELLGNPELDTNKEEKHRWLDAVESVARHIETTLGLHLLLSDVFGPSLSDYYLQRDPTRSCSHVHWVTYHIGDLDYVQRRLQDTPEAMHSDGERSLLLAAMHGLRVPIVNYLLDNGVSPHGQVASLDLGHRTLKMPVWVSFCTQLVDSTLRLHHLHHRRSTPDRVGICYRMLESLRY
jgi:hypothetical protein